MWDQLQNSDVPPPQADLAKWEAEFNQLMNSGREDDVDYDFESPLREAFQSGLGLDQTLPQQFDDEGLPILTPYAFESHNKHLDPSTSVRSPLAEAKALLDQNGSLSEAALLLEAAVQTGELGEGGYETWVLLGETRNMDEREEAGMRALAEGVKRAEAAGAAGVGQLVSTYPSRATMISWPYMTDLVIGHFIYERVIRTSILCYATALAQSSIPIPPRTRRYDLCCEKPLDLGRPQSRDRRLPQSCAYPT